VVFKADETMRSIAVLGRCDRSIVEGVTGGWTPTEQDRRLLDRQVRLDIATVSPDSSRLGQDGYYLQLLGVYHGDKRVIIVNGFHETLLPDPTSGTQPLGDWTREAIVICDGGTGSFQAGYDSRGRELIRMRFGGRFGPS
jgi:hypothetical protein